MWFVLCVLDVEFILNHIVQYRHGWLIQTITSWYIYKKQNKTLSDSWVPLLCGHDISFEASLSGHDLSMYRWLQQAWQQMRTERPANQYSQRWRRPSKESVQRSILLHSKRLTHFDFYTIWLLDFFLEILQSYFDVLGEFFLRVFSIGNTNYYIARKVFFPFKKWQTCQVFKINLLLKNLPTGEAKSNGRLRTSDLAPNGWETLWWQRLGGRVIKCCSGDTWVLRLIYSSNPLNGLLCFRIYHVIIMAFASKGRF